MLEFRYFSQTTVTHVFNCAVCTMISVFCHLFRCLHFLLLLSPPPPPPPPTPNKRLVLKLFFHQAQRDFLSFFLSADAYWLKHLTA